jgi:hypothetical protein
MIAGINGRQVKDQPEVADAADYRNVLATAGVAAKPRPLL